MFGSKMMAEKTIFGIETPHPSPLSDNQLRSDQSPWEVAHPGKLRTESIFEIDGGGRLEQWCSWKRRMVMRDDEDDDDDVGVGVGKFGCGGRRQTPHGRRFFAVLTVAWLLWRRCRPFFLNAVAAACVVVVFVVARPLSVVVCVEGR